MQNTAVINDAALAETGKFRLSEGRIFELLCYLLFIAAALSAAALPFTLSVLAVFLFAGPHNFIELRYFISRLPSRLGPLRAFFLSSSCGVALLGASYAALLLLNRQTILDSDSGILLFRAWILAFHFWIALLLLTRTKTKPKPKVSAAASILILLSALLALVYPLQFGVLLVYLHPLMALWILDRELARLRPSLVKRLRRAVLILPLLMLGIVISGSQLQLPQSVLPLQENICIQAGSFLFPDISACLLVSLHTFLETIHYAVWIIAIPSLSFLFRNGRWQPANMPVSRSSKPVQMLLSTLFFLSALLVFGLWFAFLNDYTATRQLYFTVAVFHILAEIPFLLWIL